MTIELPGVKVCAQMTGDSNKTGVREKLSVWGIRARIAAGRWLRSFLRPGSLVVSAFALAYTVCQLLKEEEIPSKDAWTRHQPLGWVLVASGVVALIGTLLVFAGYNRALRKAEENDELEEACRAIWHLVVERLNIDMKKVGVHIWAVKGIKGFRYLGRRATFVIENRRSTHVLWRKGKGAVGVAWDDDEPLVANVENLQLRGATREAFDAIPKRERFGLDWREFRRSRHYRAILAIPLRAQGNVKGCLSVDIQVDGYADALDTLTTDDDFNNVLVVCEAVLGRRH